MKKSILLPLLVVLSTLSISAQELNYNSHYKLDCDRAFPVWGEDLNRVGFGINFQDSFQIDDITFDGVGQKDALLLYSDIDAIVYAGLIGTESNEELLRLDLYDEGKGGYFLLSYEDTVIVDIFNELIDIHTPGDESIAVINAYDGDVLWTGRLDGDESTVIQGSPADDGYLIGGNFTDSLIYTDPLGNETVYTSEGNYANYLLKLDEVGTPLWMYKQDGPFPAILRHLSHHDGLTYFMYLNLPNTEIHIIDEEGNQEDLLVLVSAGGHHIEMTDDGSMYICGNFDAGELTDFDFSDSTSYVIEGDHSLEIFIAKYDAEMNLLWVQTVLGQNIDTATHLDVDESGVYVTGCIQRDGTFDPDGVAEKLESVGSEDAFVSHYDLEGNYQWARLLTGPSADIGTRIKVYSDEVGDKSILLFGQFLNSIDLDPDPSEEVLIEDNYPQAEFSYFTALYDYNIVSANEDLKSPAEIKVWPVPTQDFINVSIALDRYIITDMQGRVMQSYEGVPTQSIELERMPLGAYILSAISDGATIQKRFVKI